MYLRLKSFTEFEKQDERVVQRRVDNEIRDPKVIKRRDNANVKPQRFNTSSYVIQQLDIGTRNVEIFMFFVVVDRCRIFIPFFFTPCILDDNKIKIEKLEEKFSPKRMIDAKAIEG